MLAPMRRFTTVVCLSLAVALSACDGGDGAASEAIDSTCVRDKYPEDVWDGREADEGDGCSTLGHSSCPTCDRIGRCKGDLVCAHGICQSRNGCATDGDCLGIPGGNHACADSVVSKGSTECSFGKFCKEAPQCKPGTFCDGVLCCTYVCENGVKRQTTCK